MSTDQGWDRAERCPVACPRCGARCAEDAGHGERHTCVRCLTETVVACQEVYAAARRVVQRMDANNAPTVAVPATALVRLAKAVGL